MSRGESESAAAFGGGLWFMVAAQIVGFALGHVVLGDGVAGVYVATVALLGFDVVCSPVRGP